MESTTAPVKSQPEGQKLTFDKEESLQRSQIPLGKFKKQLEDGPSLDTIQVIDFEGNGYCTDAVIKVILSHKKATQKKLLALSDVNLAGCQMLTDIGVKWLSEILEDAENVKNITLDGCQNITDAGLIKLIDATPKLCRIFLRGASVRHTISTKGKLVRLFGSTQFPEMGDPYDDKHGQVLVVPHSSMKNNLSEFLKTKNSMPKVPISHSPDVDFGNNWKLTINEVAPESPLLDMMISENPVQVIIPFDVSAEPKDVAKHITNTVARVTSKEKFAPKIQPPSAKVSLQTGANYTKFMDVRSVYHHRFDISTGILSNWPGDVAEDRIGCYYSRNPLSRSYNYFEVEVVEAKFAGTQDEKMGLMVGCLFESLFETRNPMSSTSDTGGEVQSFEVSDMDRFGFGISGEWESEYMPGPNCKVYATKNGIIATDEEQLSKKALELKCYYPLVTLLTEKNSLLRVKLLNFACPPKMLLDYWETHEKWARPSYLKNCTIDKEGIFSMSHFSTRQEDAHYISENSIGLKGTPQSEFTIRIIDGGPEQKVVFGIADEKHEFGKSKDYVAFIAMDGNVKKNDVAQEMLEKATPVQQGDEITFKTELEQLQDDFCEKKEGKVQVFRNKKLVCETMWDFKYSGGIPSAKVIVKLVAGERKIQLLNHQPLYRKPVIFRDKITFGRVRRVEVSDDGTMACGPQFGVNTFGVFVSKTQFNSQLMYFEFKPLKAPFKVTIGVSHEEKPPGFYLGMNQCELGLHNTGALSDHCLGTANAEREYKVGDIVGCGIEDAELDEDGFLMQQQHILVYFTRNGERIETVKFYYRSDGLYPSIMLEKPGCEAQVLNYFYETKEHYEAQDASIKAEEEKLKKEQEQVSKLTEEEKQKEFTGCNFMVVGCGNSASSVSGKIQVLESMVDVKSVPASQQISENITTLEKNLDALTFQDQQRYIRFLSAQESFETLKQNPDRLHFLTADMKSGQGHDEIRKKILENFDVHYRHQKGRYRITKTISSIMSDAMKKVRENKLCEATANSFSVDKLTGDIFLEILHMTHELGNFLMVKLDSETIVLDIPFAAELLSNLEKVSGMKLEKGITTVMGDLSHVWTVSVLKKNIGKILEDNNERVLSLLNNYLGLIRVPCWRTVPTDEQFVFTTKDNLSVAPVKLRDFWSNGKESQENFVLVQRTYSFPYELPPYVMSLILAATTKYGRILTITSEGGAFQLGAIQTVIIQHSGIVGNTVISVESKCYMPKRKDDNVNQLTERNVKEYTYQVFCLYTDLIDRILKRQNLLPIISENVPKGLVNVSFGCKHTWTAFENIKQVQSVCTLCNECCDKGSNCEWNGLVGSYLRECPCKTKTTGCRDCGICVNCAKFVWDLRSELRPMPNTCSNTWEFTSIGMDPVGFSEVDVWILGGLAPSVCLKNTSDGSLISVLPSKASMINENDTQKIKEKLEEISKKSTGNNKYTLRARDKIKLRLTDPLGAITKEETAKGLGVAESRVIYHAIICRESRICQENGILCYDSVSSAMPVAQFIGPKPFSENLTSFSIKIRSVGEDAAIAVGICPNTYPTNRQPGWNRYSIAYHADDGGIFVEAGYSKVKKLTCTNGDIMKVSLDTVERELKFFKNDEEQYSTKVNIPRGGYYPAVGLHSPGEVVELLQVEPWIPEASETASMKPNSFDTYKYGNLWISPARTINIRKYGTRGLHSWIILQNPSKAVTGYKIEPSDFLRNPEKAVGYLTKQASLEIWLYAAKTSTPLQDMKITFIALDRNKEYQDEEILELFRVSPADSIFTHHLTMTSSSTMSDLETLVTYEQEPNPANKNSYLLEVYKNYGLIEKYWINSGEYRLEMPVPKGGCIIKYPKCPTHLYPTQIDTGMKMVVKLDGEENKLAEAVVTEIEDGSRYTLEYTPKKSQENSTFFCDADSLGITESQWAPDTRILLYKAEPSNKLLSNTYVCAPPYMIASGSKKAMDSIDDDWTDEALRSFALCSQKLTRVTVQEQLITHQSRTLASWLSGYGPNSHVDAAYAFLPRKLDAQFLTYPVAMNMYEDLAVHKLCSFADQVRHFQPTKGVSLRIPIHFMDMPGLQPQEQPPVTLTFGCLYQGWIYIALIAQRLLLPSYSQLFAADMGNYSRQTIERLMFQLIQPYASLCSIYAAQYGGLQNQENPVNGSEKVQNLIEHIEPEPIKFQGEPITESHKLIKQGRLYTCKAHLIALSGNPGMYGDDLTMKFQYFEPYTELVNAFTWDLPKLPCFPKEFFTKFHNLQYFSLESSALKDSPVFPEGIGKLQELETVVMRDLGISKLPKDLLQGPSLETVECISVPVKKLDLVWPSSSILTKLVLSGLLMTEIPQELSGLMELLELCLDYNPIKTLPMELQKLTKLKILSIRGMPMITFEGNKEMMTKDQYRMWHKENPCSTHYLTEKVVEQMFDEFDSNNNALLELKELAQLNLKLFFSIPRLGFDDGLIEYGGVPPVVYELKSLEELYLSHQGITHITSHVTNLVNLRILEVNHCPLLEGLAGSVGLLPNIKSFNLHSCPSLRTPPIEVIGRGFESVRAYLKRLAGGYTECRRTKLMFVGLGEAGKTSLLQALMSPEKKTKGTQNAQLTDGIEIKPWTIRSDTGLDITFSAWDFAGQTVYYNTHQFFLSNRAIYMLLWNMRMGFEHAGLDFWLSSIACHAPETPIIIIGTQSDQVPKTDIPEKDLRKRYPQISNFHYVSSITGDGIPELQKDLISVTLRQKYMGEKIPQVWLNLEKKILAERTKKSILDWSMVEDFAMEQGIYDEKDVKQAVKFLDDLGTVQYFDNDFLRDKIVINPQWIVNVMACVVSVKQSPIQRNNGRFIHENIKDVWGAYDEGLHNWLLNLTEEFDLTFPLPGQTINIVPCLLPLEPPQELKWPEPDRDHGIRESKMLYKFGYLPAGLFNRAQVRLFQFSDGKLIWKKGSYLKKNSHYAIIRQESDSELVVLVQGPRPENILLIIHEVFESLIEESFHGVTYDFYIPCPDCISKEGTKEPCLFKAELIRRAKDLKAPFLQCTKYFHTISMGQLLEQMPEDKNTDFDVHLQHSISALQSINSAMKKDIALLFCSADLPKSDSDDKVNPMQIKADLEQCGYSVWAVEDMTKIKIQDLILSLKNCKIVVACLSDEFERDMKCSDLYVYAKEQLMKQIGIAVIHPSMAWQSTNLGMKIGQPKMAMIKTKERYAKKIKDLQDIVEDYIAGTEKDVEHPEVFISYCWVNSKEACGMGTVPKPGSVGFGDPRQIKKFLTSKGISCWLDIEQMSKCGLYQDIAVGLQNCKLFLACVSDEYVESDPCMMEMRFAVCNMDLPVVVAVIGTGGNWKKSEVSLLMRRSSQGTSKVYMQKEDPDSYDTLLQMVKDALPKEGETTAAERKRLKLEKMRQKMEKNRQVKSTQQLSYQEEYELIQRKFIRHIITMTNTMELLSLPKLLVFDFVKPVESVQTEAENPSDGRKSSQGLRPKSSTLSKERIKNTAALTGISKLRKVMQNVLGGEEGEDSWEGLDFCIKVLCEDEEGWHLVDKQLSLVTRTSEEIFKTLKDAAPYLARIYAILTQSAVKLNCMAGKVGEAFLKYLEQEGKSTTNFVRAYLAVHQMVSEHENYEEFIQPLDRCHLPSGKVAWLCENHSKGERITKLSQGSVNSHGAGKIMLTKEDELLKEYMQDYPDYQRLKKRIKEAGPESEPEIHDTRPHIEKETEETKKTESESKPETNSETDSKTETKPENELELETTNSPKSKTLKAPEIQTGPRSPDKSAANKNGTVKTSRGSDKKTDSTSRDSSASETSSKLSTASNPKSNKTLQRHYSKSGKQKSQACVLQ